MTYVVGYRGYDIVRERDNGPFLIYRHFQDAVTRKLASQIAFWSFGDARREVDRELPRVN